MPLSTHARDRFDLFVREARVVPQGRKSHALGGEPRRHDAGLGRGRRSRRLWRARRRTTAGQTARAGRVDGRARSAPARSARCLRRTSAGAARPASPRRRRRPPTRTPAVALTMAAAVRFLTLRTDQMIRPARFRLRTARRARLRDTMTPCRCGLPWSEPAKAPRARQLTIAGTSVPVTIARHRLARRYVVRVSPEGGLRLTVPRGASLAGGLAFAERQADWISREMDRQRARQAPWVTGSRTWFRGDEVSIEVSDTRATFGPEVVARPSPDADVRAAIEARLRELAAAELPDRCQALARQAGVEVAQVSVRNQRSRWGACSLEEGDHAELAVGADAGVGQRLRHLPRVDARAPAESLAALLARSGRRLLVVARRRALVAPERQGAAAVTRAGGT